MRLDGARAFFCRGFFSFAETEPSQTQLREANHPRLQTYSLVCSSLRVSCSTYIKYCRQFLDAPGWPRPLGVSCIALGGRKTG